MSYIIEGNIDFFNALDNSDVLQDDITDDNVCFIDGSQLADNHVQLPCQHTFNYDALFKDIYNHKKYNNSHEDIRVPINGIRCPYCRTIHNNFMLPSLDSKPKIFGVNYYCTELDLDKIYSNAFHIEQCSIQSCGNMYGNILKGQYFCKQHLRKEILKELKILDSKYVANVNKELRIILKNNMGSCCGILKSGKRKGDKCGRSCPLEIQYCRSHNKK